jgi:hypothetical protein
VSVVTFRDGDVEKEFNFDFEDEDELEDTLGDLLCMIFDVPAVRYRIEVYEPTNNLTN